MNIQTEKSFFLRCLFPFGRTILQGLWTDCRTQHMHD